MKLISLFVICIALTQAKLDISTSAQMVQFLQLKEQAGNAVDAVMDVLNGLKQSAVDERKALDVMHDAEVDRQNAKIGALTTIMKTNRGIYDDAIANREFVEKEIINTKNYIAYIDNRFHEIDALIEELHDERCDASLVFVTRTREHYQAMDAVQLLKNDLNDWEAAGMPTSFVEIKKMESFSKLGAYTQLFKKEALNNFLQLTEDKVNKRTEAQVGDDHVDNQRGALQLDTQDAVQDTGSTLIPRLMQKLDGFSDHLTQSMDKLIRSEIRAGRDTVDFIQESEKEIHILQVELERYQAYDAKLESDIVLAQDLENRSKLAWEESVTAVENAKTELKMHIAFYMKEIDRLRNDVEVVDEVIRIFLEELNGIDDVIRNQKDAIVGVVDDERFGQGLFGNVEQQTGGYTGQGGNEGAQYARQN